MGSLNTTAPCKRPLRQWDEKSPQTFRNPELTLPAPSAPPEKSPLEKLVEPLWGKLLVLGVGVLVPVAGQILLKLGTQQIGALDFGKGPGLLVDVFTNPAVLAGLVFFGAGLLLYLTLISILDISLVYPVGAFAYVVITAITATGALGLEKEPLSLVRLLGLVAIIGGVTLIALSSQEKKHPTGPDPSPDKETP